MDNAVKQYFTIAYWKELLLEFWQALGTKKLWKEFVIMNLGIAIGAVAVYYFLMPSKLIIGTISGLSIVLNTLFGGTAGRVTFHDVNFGFFGIFG